MKSLLKLLLTGGIILPCIGFAQENGFKTLPFTDLSEFRSQAGNWQVAGSVVMYPDREILHENPTPAVPEKKKGKKNAPVVAPLPAVEFKSGTGILLNINDATHKDHLLTTWEHGDIELEFDVMLPKGSNSGVYLQGRYEVQLLDSWGVKNPAFSDIGGIYRNWESTPGKIYSGKAPLVNAAKAPGLWQHFRISFQAPRFNSEGQKIENARLHFVELNGVRIHENLEIPLPTGGPIENNETASGPLMIQGDHGPVAFRNFKYKLLKSKLVTLSAVEWVTYLGSFKSAEEVKVAKPHASGKSNELTCEVLDTDNAYGVRYNATLEIPEADEYQLLFGYTGGLQVLIDGNKILDKATPDAWNGEPIRINLAKGSHTLEIWNFKDAGWLPPRLALVAESPTMYPVMLHGFNSYPPDDSPVSEIFLNPDSKPRLLRAFVDFKGDRNKRLTHTIGVGDPTGINYIYDLNRGNLVAGWRGEFVDATPMWHDRGDGSFRPRGSAQFTFIGQPLAVLKTPTDAFPVDPEVKFISKGYDLDENSRPVFKAEYYGMKLSTQVVPEDNNRILTTTIKIDGPIAPGLYYKLSEGSSIVEIEPGLFAIDDNQYYLRIQGPVQRRSINSKQEIFVPVTGNSIKYSIIW